MSKAGVDVPLYNLVCVGEELTIWVESEVSEVEVAAATVDVTLDVAITKGVGSSICVVGSSICVVCSGGLLRYVVGTTWMSGALGRYGSHSNGMASQPDLPTCRHDSSQSFINTVQVSDTSATRSRWVQLTSTVIAVGALLQQAVARELAVGAELTIDVADAAEVSLAEWFGNTRMRNLSKLSGIRSIVFWQVRIPRSL